MNEATGMNSQVSNVFRQYCKERSKQKQRVCGGIKHATSDPSTSAGSDRTPLSTDSSDRKDNRFTKDVLGRFPGMHGRPEES